MELGDDDKCAVKEEGAIKFELLSKGILGSKDVLFVPKLKNNFLSLSVMEDKEYEFMFMNRHMLILLNDISIDIAMVFEVRKGNL